VFTDGYQVTGIQLAAATYIQRPSTGWTRCVSCGSSGEAASLQ